MADGVIVKGIYVRVGEEGIWDVERTAWENPFDLSALWRSAVPHAPWCILRVRFDSSIGLGPTRQI